MRDLFAADAADAKGRSPSLAPLSMACDPNKSPDLADAASYGFSKAQEQGLGAVYDAAKKRLDRARHEHSLANSHVREALIRLSESAGEVALALKQERDANLELTKTLMRNV